MSIPPEWLIPACSVGSVKRSSPALGGKKTRGFQQALKNRSRHRGKGPVTPFGSRRGEQGLTAAWAAGRILGDFRRKVPGEDTALPCLHVPGCFSGWKSGMCWERLEYEGGRSGIHAGSENPMFTGLWCCWNVAHPKKHPKGDTQLFPSSRQRSPSIPNS